MFADFNVTFAVILRTTYNPTGIPELYHNNFRNTLKTHDMDTKVFTNDSSYVWTLSKRFQKCTDIDTNLSEFLECIPDYHKFVQRLKQYGECVVRISVVSTFGQFGFSIAPSDIGILNQLNIPLEITVFSYGECIDSEDSEDLNAGLCSKANDFST
ncbi:MAG: hypothetical protein ACI3W5_14200 [Faecousia sp.]